MTRVAGAQRWLDHLAPRGWTLLAASTFGLGGVLAGASLTTLLFGRTYADPTGPDALVLVAGAGIGGLVLGGPFWWRLVEAPRRASVYRGGGTGVLTGLLANFVAWGVHYLYSLATLGTGGTPLEVLGTMGAYVLVVGGTSMAVTGIVTGPVGAVIGIALARLRRRSLDGPPPASPAVDPAE